MRKLLLHTCCAPCFTIAEEKLTNIYTKSSLDKYDIFWCNPNISPESEHQKRLNELKRFCKEKEINIILDENTLDYSVAYGEWGRSVKGLEEEPEGGKRCSVCIFKRLESTAIYASQNGYNAFSTTLTSSPYKDADLIYQIGEELEKRYNIEFEFHDFTENNGYRRSIEICRELNIYRQKYCGCEYSLRGSH